MEKEKSELADVSVRWKYYSSPRDWHTLEPHIDKHTWLQKYVKSESNVWKRHPEGNRSVNIDIIYNYFLFFVLSVTLRLSLIDVVPKQKRSSPVNSCYELQLTVFLWLGWSINRCSLEKLAMTKQNLWTSAPATFTFLIILNPELTLDMKYCIVWECTEENSNFWQPWGQGHDVGCT